MTNDNENKSEKVGLLTRIDPDLRENFRIKTIKEKTTMADVVVEAIKKYVENK